MEATHTTARPGEDDRLPAYASIVVGFDGSMHAADALALGRMLAGATGARLLVTAVVPHEFPYVPGTEQRESELTRSAADMLGDVVPAQVGAETRVIRARSAAHGLHDLAESARADLLVVGSSHRGTIGRVLAGSVATDLLHCAPCAVAVAPVGLAGRPDPAVRVIACAVDGSPESHVAVRHAESLARAAHVPLRLLTAHQPELIFGADVVPAGYDLKALVEDARRQLEEMLEETAASIGAGVEVQRFVLEGAPVRALAGAAENGVDILVVGSRHYGPIRRVLLGSVSSGLVRSSPTSILVVPRGESGTNGTIDRTEV